MKQVKESLLSKTQSGIYVEDITNPNSTLYNLPFLGKLGEDIDEARLKIAIEKAIMAHPGLRTILYVNDRGEVIQKISDKKIEVNIIDISDEDFSSVKKNLVRPFNLEGGFLCRFELYRTPTATYWFQDIHHVIHDGVSQAILERDIRKAYDGEELETETYTGIDAAEDEIRCSESEKYVKAKAFYANLLDGCEGDCLPVQDVFEDEPKQAWIRYDFNLDSDVLKSFRKETGISMTGFFTSVMGFIIAKYNFKEDSVIATIYNGRTQANKNTMSMFVKTLPFVTEFSGNPSIRDFLKKSNDQLIESRTHDIYSFAEIAAEYGVTSDISFAYQGHILDVQMMQDSNIRVERIYDENHIEHTSLLFELSEIGNNLYELHIGYRADKFSHSFVENMARAYAKTAEEFLVKEHADDVEMADDKVFSQIEIFNQTERPYDREKTIVALFAEQAEYHPDHRALVYMEKEYTYAQLDDLSNRLAHQLRKCGIGKEDVVGILIPRCEYMAICGLGVLKAGAGYLPLDPTYPPERLNLMMNDSGAKVLITTPELSSVISEENPSLRIMTHEIEHMEYTDEVLPKPEIKDLFVMLYTSGSTGLPKGVMLEHGNVAAMCAWARNYYSMNESSSSTAYASFGFDAHLFELYAILTSGGTLHVIDESIRLDLIALQKYFNKHKITHTQMTTQVGRQFALMDGTETLQHLMVGGEKLVPLDPPSFRMHNAYGPTECTLLITIKELDKKYKDVPVGPALDNIKLYVVDKNGKMLPVGAAGELWAAGYQVGRAYLNRPDKTAEAFSVNPFCQKKGYERVYHTGDVVRFMENGEIQFIGRRDAQVKIRGFRIELTEVEEVIRRFPGIKDATVAAFDEISGGKYIAAYIVADEKISIDALNAFILEEKPPYMVPAVTMQIDAIPMNQNQKVNKRALPKPEKKAEEIIAPKTEIQKKIFECVADAVGHDVFGVTTDIYNAGLTSVSAIRLNILLSKAFDISVKTSDLKRCPTVLKLEQFVLESTTLETHEVREDYPLTNSQYGVFVDSMANVGTTVYNIPSLFEISNELEIERLKSAIQITVNAHPYLKTQLFTDESGEIRQRRNDELPVTVEVVEGLDKDLLVRPFELFDSPLYRFEIHKSDDKHYLFIDVHHMIADGTSMAIILQDMNRAYGGEMIDTEKYSGYEVALEQESLANSDAYKKAEAFYQSIFDDCDGDTGFYPDKTEKTAKAGSLSVVDEHITPDMVKSFCKKYGITENVFFVGAFGDLLSKYQYIDDAVFTTIYHGRNDSRLADTVGMLVKTLPVRTRMNRDLQVYFAELRDYLMNAMDHDIYPFAEISRNFDILPNAMVAYQGDDFVFDSIGGKEAKSIPLTLNMTKEPIVLQIFVKDGHFVYDFEFRADMFSNQFMTNLARAYRKAVQEIVVKERVEDIEIADETAIEQVGLFNQTEHPFNQEKTVIDLFREQAKKCPNHTALVYLDKKYTYKELDLITDRLAKKLCQLGIKKDNVAGVLIPRCEFMVICALGILKAGGGYLPLDPTYPEERLNLMMTDSGAKVLITTETLNSMIHDEYKGVRMMVDEIFALEDSDMPLPSPDRHDLFIMLYTSGSTGLPKGVMLEHGNIAAFCDWAKRYYVIDEHTRSAAYASFGFDANMFDTYPVLTAGGTLYIIDESIRLDLVELQKYYNENKITHSLITTQVGRQFALMQGTTTLKHLTVGGEKLVPLNPPDYHMYNAYGPTECTILTNIARVDKKYDDVPIGPAIDNIKLYVVDKNGRLLPPGAVGELWVAGYQVARSYLNRPDKTAEAFTDNPFCREDGYDRVYHTGDVVRFMEDGSVQFIGRRDAQVKIRGFRIELTEVEEVIRRFPGIKDATVAAFDEISGGKYIAAYIVADETISVDALNAFILEEKPPYMVPAVTMQIDSIPMNQNQKVNKRALPKPEKKAEEIIAPKTDLQKKIFECVADAVGHDAFGVTTDIYNAGLTSVSAIRLNILLSKAFDISVKTSDLKRCSTVLKLEQFVLESTLSETHEVREDYPLTNTQYGVFVDSMANAGTTVYNIPSLFEISNEIDAERLKAAVLTAVNAHPYLKTQVFMDEEGEIRQRRNDGLPVNVEVFEGLDKNQLVRPFELFDSPLYRFEIHRANDKQYLFMDVHHMIADGTSMAILLQDINRAYDGENVETESYSSYDAALDHEAMLESDIYKKAEAYYHQIFGDCGGDTSFYSDKNGREPSASYCEIIDENITPDEVKAFCRKHGITENVYFVGVFGALLAKYHFKNEAVFTTIYHGRNDSRLADSVGMFVKTFPVRVHLTEDINAYFANVRDQLMNAMDYDIYPFSEISRTYQIQPNAMLVYQGDNFEFNNIGGKEAKSIPLRLNMAKEPISLQVSIEKGHFVYHLEYREDMFEEETIRFILENFIMMAAGFVDGKSVSNIRLMFEETVEMVDDPVYAGKTFIDLFKDSVEKYPNRPAVKDANGILTYAELDRMSDYVAVQLKQSGFGREKTAGILSGRTREFVIAYVGIMKAGGAYVPLDPEYPRERLEYMMEDSGSENLLAVREFAHLTDFYKGNILWLDDVEKESEDFVLSEKLERPRTEDLAYMIYTSGSTGKPKGVMIEHRNLVNLIQHEVYFHKPTQEDIYAEFASFCFDASIHDLFVPFTVGAMLYIFPENIRKDAVQVAETIRKEKITLSTFPTQMGELLAEILVDDCNLRILTLGGEKFKRYYDRKYIMVNGYGPTENTVSSTEFVVDKDYKNIPIGKSQVNVRSYIVDEAMKRVPVGVPGELCHAGRQVARGYHNLPEKTAAVFVNNPFVTCPDDARMYRTGDMVRMKGDGNIEYIGRIDSQVKIRGYRVELSEIEGAVLTFAGIKEVAVNVIEKSGNKYIVAYYTGSTQDADAWKDFLKPLLPEYMIPSFYVYLEHMPITPGGKIDKRALPEPEIQVERSNYVPPVTEAQKNLCQMFEKALGMDNVGIGDNFFEIGGTSLTASKVAVMCMTKQLAIVYADIFKYPTVRLLAELIDSEETEEEVYKDEYASYDYERVNFKLKPNYMKNVDSVQKEDIGNILLTGATGFLGIHVLKDYLENYGGRVYCLVRKSKTLSSEKRLMNMLMYYFDNPHEELFGKRIICIDGDITDKEQVLNLSQYPFDTLINCAACVKHFTSDDTLERINVDGVKHLIDLCMSEGRRLIQISTISVAGEGLTEEMGMNRLLGENELYIGQHINNEYIRTKFLAERYVLEAVYNGLDAKIIRVGNLMSRDSDGEFQINFVTNGFLRSVRGYVAVGAFPMGGMGQSAEFSPIDSTAAAILKLSGTDKRFTVYHATNNHSIFMSDLIYAMKHHGFDIQIVDDKQFEQMLGEYAVNHEESDLVSGLIAYSSREGEAVYPIGYSNRFTTEVLYRLGYKWPITDDDYLENAIDKLERLGFFGI